jgi:fructose-bisphosphate aldolase class I
VQGFAGNARPPEGLRRNNPRESNDKESEMNDLEQTARALVAPGKGILAADESSGTIKKRFDSIGVESNEDTRRAYRDLLFTTEGAADHISGVILYDETIRQSTSDGTPFPEYLEEQGVIPGIKVDLGAKPLAKAPDETITEGLDGLRDRLNEYRELGARFAKWRAVISIGDGIPSEYCLWTNAHALARYAALCQEAGIVPIVEPEVLMDGDHTIERSFEVTSRTLHAVFTELRDQRVEPEDMLLKPNMVLSGYDGSEEASDQQIAELTLKCFRRHVPGAVPGIVFLSGGQSDEDATARLNAINAMGPHPWEISFSYGRALQAPALKAWSGEAGNVQAGQDAYLHRAKMNGLARSGSYSPDMEEKVAA